MPARFARALAALGVLALLLPALPARAQPGLALPPTAPARADAAYADARALYDARLFGAAADAFAAYRAAYPDGPRRAEALFYASESALAAGDVTRAAAGFARFRADYPGHALAGRATLALGEHFYREGRYDEAEAALLDGLDDARSPDDAARAYYLLGLAQHQQGRDGDALVAFDNAADLAPGSPAAPLALYAAGRVRFEQRDWSGAAATFERLAREHPASPQHADAGLALAESYARLGRPRDVLTAIATLPPGLSEDNQERRNLLEGDALFRLGRTEEARRRLAVIPAASPYARRALYGLARLDYDVGDYGLAAEGFAEVRRLPGEGESDDALAHEAAYYEGLALKQQGRLGEAEDRLVDATQRRNGAYADAAHLELGLLRFERRRYDEAAAAFEALLSTYPSSPYAGEAARMAGEAYAALGDTRRARDAAQRAERLGAGSAELGVEVDFMEAYGRYRDGRYAEAVPALVAVYEADPSGPRAGEALFWAGESAFQAREYGRSEDLLRRLLDRFPSHRQADAARYVLAWTYFKREDYAGAAAAFERFLSAYTRSAESVPYYADALLRLGDSYYALRRFDDAVAVYRRVERATPDARGFDYALFQTGQAHAATGRPDDALATFERALREVPQSPLRAEIRYARGSLLFQQGRYEEAIAAYRQIVDQHAQSAIAPKALYGIGDAHYNAERYAEAEATYRAVLTRYPRSPFVTDALDGLQAALDAQGRGDEFDALARAYGGAPAPSPAPLQNRPAPPVQNETPRPMPPPVTPPSAVSDQVRFRQAEQAYEVGDFAGAVERLDALFADAPDPALVPQALFLLGSAHAALGNPDRAADAFGRLADGYPESPLRAEAVLRQGEVLLAGSRFTEATDVLARYADRFPGNPEQIGAALLAEADALTALGREAAAGRRLDQLLADYPDTAAAAEVLRRQSAGGDD